MGKTTSNSSNKKLGSIAQAIKGLLVPGSANSSNPGGPGPGPGSSTGGPRLSTTSTGRRSLSESITSSLKMNQPSAEL